MCSRRKTPKTIKNLFINETYCCQSNTKRREKFIKGGKGRAELKIQLKDIFDKLDYKI